MGNAPLLHISARSSVVMEPQNSLITSENLSDD